MTRRMSQVMTDGARTIAATPHAGGRHRRRRSARRSVVLVGMMGAGKSSIGRRLAARLGIPFVDADTEIEKAAGMTIPISSRPTARPISAPARRA